MSIPKKFLFLLLVSFLELVFVTSAVYSAGALELHEMSETWLYPISLLQEFTLYGLIALFLVLPLVVAPYIAFIEHKHSRGDKHPFRTTGLNAAKRIVSVFRTAITATRRLSLALAPAALAVGLAVALDLFSTNSPLTKELSNLGLLLGAAIALLRAKHILAFLLAPLSSAFSGLSGTQAVELSEDIMHGKLTDFILFGTLATVVTATLFSFASQPGSFFYDSMGEQAFAVSSSILTAALVALALPLLIGLFDFVSDGIRRRNTRHLQPLLERNRSFAVSVGSRVSVY